MSLPAPTPVFDRLADDRDPTDRRRCLQWALGSALAATLGPVPLTAQAATPEVIAALRRGGLVVAFRHADAPGNFDPPGFRLGDCSTQRNLGEQGRAQAQRIGAWFRENDLKPRRVRSSPWCRCMDTATLAFGEAQPWDALSSAIGVADTTPQVAAMREALQALPATGFEVWVSHQVTLGALVGESTSSGEALLIRADRPATPGTPGPITVIGRFLLS